MFLSSLVKTQSKSSALNASYASLSLTRNINQKNSFIKLQLKNVSRSVTSKENREKYDLKKMDDYWDSVDKEFNRRMDILKEIEEKYKTKSENLISSSASKKSATAVYQTKEIYFVPLTKSDENILKTYFKAEICDDIRKGGRLVLADEVRKYNKKHSATFSASSRIEFDFEPLDAQDFERIKRQFNFLVSEKEFFVVALQQGKKIFEFLNAFKNHKADLLGNLNAAFRRIEHLEAIEASHPLRSNLNVSLHKIENSNWIKNLFLNNKINEKHLSEKFNKIYFEYLDCMNSAAAESRGYDVELFEDAFELKKAVEARKKNVKEKLNKITLYLDSVDYVDGKVISLIGGKVDNISKSNSKNKMKTLDSFRKGNHSEESKENLNLNSNTGSSSQSIFTNSDNKNKNQDENIKNNNVVRVVANEQEGNFELDSEEEQQEYLFDREKNYSKVFEKSEKELTFDEHEYIRFCRDKALKEEYALLNSSYDGRLLIKLIKAEQMLSRAAQVLDRNSTSLVYATENLIKSSEIDEILKELKSKKTNSINVVNHQNNKFNSQSKKLELENEENLLKLLDNPKAFLQNLYWDLVKSGAADNEIKVPESASNDKESYLFKVLLKYFADVVQSKSHQFCEKDSRLEYFGENLKAYKWFENTSKQNITNNTDNNNTNNTEELNDEEKANPEILFTPTFKKLVDFLYTKHGIIEKKVYDYKFNVESERFCYPFNVVDLSESLAVNDPLGKEILRFYLDNSTDKSLLLSEKDEEKVYKYVTKYLSEVQKGLQTKYSENAEGI